jgi:hypothetical protein
MIFLFSGCCVLWHCIDHFFLCFNIFSATRSTYDKNDAAADQKVDHIYFSLI